MGVHGELADVVEEGGPAQPVPIGLGEPHFVGDHVGKCPDPFRVPTGLSIVTTERGGKRQDLLCHGGRHFLVRTRSCGRAAFELSGRTRPPRDFQALGGLVGEKHAHLQQGGQREKAPTETLRADEGNRRRTEHHYPPKRLPEDGMPARKLAPHRHGGRYRYGEGSHDRCGRKDHAQQAVRPPPLRLDHLALRYHEGRSIVIVFI